MNLRGRCTAVCAAPVTVYIEIVVMCFWYVYDPRGLPTSIAKGLWQRSARQNGCGHIPFCQNRCCPGHCHCSMYVSAINNCAL